MVLGWNHFRRVPECFNLARLQRHKLKLGLHDENRRELDDLPEMFEALEHRYRKHHNREDRQLDVERCGKVKNLLKSFVKLKKLFV